MTHFKDLSEYAYFDDQYPAINIGWLSKKEKYEKGFVASEYITRLEAFALHPVNNARGIFLCPFCPEEDDTIESNSYIINDKKYILGAAEIRVFSADLKKIYACPNLIIHYIKEHGYCPPSEFLEILIDGPLPTEQRYIDALKSIGLQVGKLSVYSKPFRFFAKN